MTTSTSRSTRLSTALTTGPERVTTSNRSAIGTRLTLTTGGRRQVREVQSGSSYLAQNDLRAHFGLGLAERAERLEIRWPDGSTEVVENLAANHLFTVQQGKGIARRSPLAARRASPPR